MADRIMLNGWIDVNDELPDDWYLVLVWFKSGCAVGHRDKDVWRDVFGFPTGEEVVAWQPLPFGPNGEGLISNVSKYWE